MRVTAIKTHDTLAGWLIEDENGYHFKYDKTYLESQHPEAISLTLPIQDQEYDSAVLSPAYDIEATAIVNPDDDEDLALTLNRKKKRIKKSDFVMAFSNLKLDPKQLENIFKKKWKRVKPNGLHVSKIVLFQMTLN